MIPIKDDNPTKSVSYIRYLILISCSLIFLFQISINNNDFFIYYFGFKPVTLFHDSNITSFYPLLTIITSMFMHGGWMHFLGNMMYLWIFADNVEEIMGSKKFLFFYLSSGIFASLTQAIFDLNSDIPMIGASGAIAGILGSYLFVFPRAKVLVLIPFFIFFTVRVPAFILLIFWFIYQFINLGSQGSNVAWGAHIGGFVFGFMYSLIFVNKMKQKGIKKSKSISHKKGKSIFLKKGPWN